MKLNLYIFILIISLLSLNLNINIQAVKPTVNFVAPEFQGTAAPFSTIRISFGCSTFGFTSADENGNWSFVFDRQTVLLTLTQTFEGGESAPSDPIEIEAFQTVSQRSSTPPNGPSDKVKITFPIDKFNIFIVTPILGIQGSAEPLSYLNFFYNGRRDDCHTWQTNENGTFNINFNLLENQTNESFFRVTATDPEGNKSTDRVPVLLTVVPLVPKRSAISIAIIEKYCPEGTFVTT